MGKFPKSKYDDSESFGEVSTNGSEEKSSIENQKRIAKLRKLNN